MSYTNSDRAYNKAFVRAREAGLDLDNAQVLAEEAAEKSWLDTEVRS